jgi:hypothetical protein
MTCSLDPTVGLALAAIGEIRPRHRFAMLRFAMLLAVTGFAALAPTGASACGRLPASVEPSGPVLRGEATPRRVQAQPVVVPHCNFTPPADGIAVNASDMRPGDMITRGEK